jgi:sortase (surface protein transpeptidase)
MNSQFLGICVVSLGLILVIAGGGFYIYANKATSNLGSLVYHPPLPNKDLATPIVNNPYASETHKSTTTGALQPNVTAIPPDPPTQQPSSNKPTPVKDSVYLLTTKSALNYDPISEGFIAIKPSKLGSLSPATGMNIPSIGLNSLIKQLAILDLDDSRTYETPKNVVGQIPSTANPGELGNIWLFGHLESPIRGEGDIFSELPKIPRLLQENHEIYIILQTMKGDYLYKATDSDVIHESDLNLYQSNQATLTMVTCVPRFVYDHRLLITSHLVGHRPTT